MIGNQEFARLLFGILPIRQAVMLMTVLVALLIIVSTEKDTEMVQRTPVNSVTVPTSAVAVTPSDTEDLPTAVRGIYVGTQGDVRVLTFDGQDVTFKNVVGTKLGAIRRVFATNTTATDIVAEW